MPRAHHRLRTNRRHRSRHPSTSRGQTSKKTLAIPRLVFQTWKTKKVPKKWRGSPESIKRLMPDWTYVLMSDQDNRNFVKRYFPDFLPYYDAFPYPIQRADAIRYMWLAKHGGVYMDLDYELQRPLDDLFEHDMGLFFVSSGNVSSMLTNAFMAGKAGHPLWYEMVEEMKQPAPSWAIGKHLEVMATTGPMALDRVVRRSRYPYCMIPSQLLIPCSVCDVGQREYPEAYIRTLEGGSWNGWDSRMYNFFLCNWRTVFPIFGMVLLVFVIWWSARKIFRRDKKVADP